MMMTILSHPKSLLKTLLNTTSAATILLSALSSPASAMMNQDDDNDWYDDQAHRAPLAPTAQEQEHEENIHLLMKTSGEVTEQILRETKKATIGALYQLVKRGHLKKDEKSSQDLDRVQSRFETFITNKISLEIYNSFDPAKISGEASKQQHLKIRADTQTYIDEEVRACAADGKTFNLFDLWESGEVKSFLQVKYHVDSLHENTAVIVLQGKGLRRCPPLDRFKNLLELDLNDNQLTSLPGLEKNKKLQILSVAGNPITSVEGLKGLKSVTNLFINRTQVTSLSGLRGLESLGNISIRETPLQSLAGLEKLPKLRFVWASKGVKDPDGIIKKLTSKDVSINY